MRKKAALHNLGCKVNAYETEAMRQLLEQEGYEIVPFAPGADVYVINTCSVTNIADRKSRQMLHRAKKMNPEALVVAAGCYVQTAGKEAQVDPAIDIILGNNQKKDLITAIHHYEEAHSEKGELLDINHTREYESLLITCTEGHTRAALKVQDGCNQFCSYCIIPYARGRVRSRALDDVLQEVKMLSESGCQEVILTGIHLSSYGTDLGTDLVTLIEAVHAVPGIERIRLGSLEPGIVTEEFAARLAALPKMCPHFHLSLQSGCTATLQRMNRRYTAEEFREKCEILRRAFELPAITTDVIVGFPGETEEEFAMTRAFLEEIRLYETHIFKYSVRKGTKAAVMPDQIPEQDKARRSEILIKLGEENRTAFEESWIGKDAEVLFEESEEIDGIQYYAGYTKEYIRTLIPADRDYSNVRKSGILAKGPAPHCFLLNVSRTL